MAVAPRVDPLFSRERASNSSGWSVGRVHAKISLSTAGKIKRNSGASPVSSGDRRSPQSTAGLSRPDRDNEDFNEAQKLIDFALTVKGIDKGSIWCKQGQLYEIKLKHKKAIKALKTAKQFGFNNDFISYIDTEISRNKSKIKSNKKPSKSKTKKKKCCNKKKKQK